MKRMIRLLALSVAALLPLSALADNWCGESFITVGPSNAAQWYTASKTPYEGSVAFNGANLGTNSSLYLGGEIQENLNTLGTTVQLGYRVKQGDTTVVTDQHLDLNYLEPVNNNGKWQTLSGGAFAPVDIVAAHSLPSGTYTIECWFKVAANGTTLYDSNNSNNYVATFTVDGAVPPAANLGVTWHCATNREPWPSYTMLTPFAPSAGETIAVRAGNWTGNSGVDTATATMRYRFATNASWSSMAMTLESGTSPVGNEYFLAEVPTSAGNAGDTMEYYFEFTYGGTSDKDDTYVGVDGTDPNMYVRFADETQARAAPFSVHVAGAPGSEPGFVYHGGNVSRISDTAVDIWVKVGYIDGTNAWADDVEIRYVVGNDAAVAGRKSGVKAVDRPLSKARALSGYTTVKMSYDHAEADSSGHGQAMWWHGVVSNAAMASSTAVLRYEIYARKTAAAGGTGNWIQAEYTATSATGTTFEYRMWSDGSGALTVIGSSRDASFEGYADYTTSKWFIDESDPNDVVDFTVRFSAPNDADAVELFTNLGRRDHVEDDMDNDGWPDGMIPPTGDSITAENTYNAGAGYWQAIPMTKSTGYYEKSLTVSQCGVYRITARYRANGATNWTWYAEMGSALQRDHVAVISPRKALEQTMYELNVLTTKATEPSHTGCGNFEGLSEKLNASGGPFDEFSIDYLNRMGINCLWFQPIHPNLDYARGNCDPDGNRYWPGSPYGTKNYFSVKNDMSSTKTEAGAVAAFTNFVRLCDKAQSDAGGTRNLKTINVMLDGVMNHTSWDAIYGEGIHLCTNGLGAAAFAELDAAYPGWRTLAPGDHIATTGTLGINWYSHNTDGSDQSYPATYYNSEYDNDIASAPERYDFGKWDDVAELLYGNYSTMVRFDDRDAGGTLGPETSKIYSEEDRYYYNEMRPATKLLWKYMAAYPEYWLRMTGNDGVNHPGVVDANGVLTDDYGIDGLRCDYAQGLPSQFWEYLINRTRTLKWNFLFMAESLDGGAVGRRSNRQFDVLNENMVFRFTQEHVSDPSTFAARLEERRGDYGNGLILLNLTCHDEVMPYGDPQATVSRYAMVSAVDGIPMIMYGQEHAISPFTVGEDDLNNANKWKGFLKFEVNFGKAIPNFKTWNVMHGWTNPPYAAGHANDSRAIAQLYGRINLARHASPALRSKNRWFINDNPRIMFCAKWSDEGLSPNVQDSVLAAVLFVNEGDGGHTGTAQTYDISPFADKLGIENSSARYYNIRNLAASDTNALIWENPRSGADIFANGVYIGFDGTSDGNTDYPATTWNDNGKVVQYLKIVDVTTYPAPMIGVGLIPTNAVTNELVSFSVTASGSGEPTIGVSAVQPSGTAYTYENSLLSFTPALATNYTFTFLAQNTLDDQTATTNVIVQVIAGSVGPSEVEVEAITAGSFTIDPATGRIGFQAQMSAGIPDGTSLEIWTADTVVNGHWNWTNVTSAVVSSGNVSISDIASPDPSSALTLISIGRPADLAQ